MKQLTLRFKQGQDLRNEIEKIVTEKKIKAGVILTIVGSLERARLRMPGATPAKQVVKKWDGPFEIVSAVGTLSLDGCHIHISISDTQGNVHGGHLKGGCFIKTTAELVLGAFDDVVYRRKPDPETGFDELTTE